MALVSWLIEYLMTLFHMQKFLRVECGGNMIILMRICRGIFQALPKQSPGGLKKATKPLTRWILWRSWDSKRGLPNKEQECWQSATLWIVYISSRIRQLTACTGLLILPIFLLLSVLSVLKFRNIFSQPFSPILLPWSFHVFLYLSISTVMLSN